MEADGEDVAGYYGPCPDDRRIDSDSDTKCDPANVCSGCDGLILVRVRGWDGPRYRGQRARRKRGRIGLDFVLLHAKS